MWFELSVCGEELDPGASPLLLHLSGAIKLVFQYVPYLPEAGHGTPARLQLARPRHAMTLTLDLHIDLNALQNKIKQLSKTRSLSAVPE